MGTTGEGIRHSLDVPADFYYAPRANLLRNNTLRQLFRVVGPRGLGATPNERNPLVPSARVRDVLRE